MQTTEIVAAIERLPLEKRRYIAEKTIDSIHREEQNELRQAAEVMLSEYENNAELTIFTQLDGEDFYETR